MTSKAPSGRKAYKGIAMEGFVAKWYAKIQKKSLGQYKSWAKLVNDNLTTDSNVLEIAPGPGYLSIELAKLGQYNITGLDISETFVKVASEKAVESGVRVDFRRSDAAYLPFPDEVFDFVICTSAFKNFPEPIKVLDEVFRVLKIGGKALIIDLRKDAPEREINEYINKMKLNVIDSFITKFSFKMLLKSSYSKNDIQELITKTKFIKYRIVDEEMGFELWLEK
jgi:ubiquinone/menaquinone biosynthesis C-methylase UbiE